MNKYKIIALIGEAGTGKDSLMHGVLSTAPDKFHEIISCTTRPPREGEAEGKSYFFLSNEEFAAKVSAGKMLEHTEFNNWHYGTMVESLSVEKLNIGVFNPSGIYTLLKRPDIELIICRLYVSDKERLLRQLNREGSPNVDEIIRRYSTDKEDFKKFYAYDIGETKYLPLFNDNYRDYKLNLNQIVALSELPED